MLTVLLDADSSNVAPAGSVLDGQPVGYDTVTLTDDAIANLTKLQLSDIELFGFEDSAIPAPECKTASSDDLYPDESTLNVLDLLTGGALIKTVPYASACYEGDHYDADLCQFLLDNWNQSTTQ